MINDTTPDEAKKFAQAMIDAEEGVELSVSQGQKGDKTATNVVLTQPQTGRSLSFYAEAAPVCYSDLSQIPTTSGGRFILKYAAVSERGINLVLEDEQTGHNYPLRVILSRVGNNVILVSYCCTHEGVSLKAVA